MMEKLLPLKKDFKGCCIICLKKVKFSKLSDPSYESETFEGGDGTEKEDGILPEIAPKSVVETPGFLQTFHEIWRVLHDSQNGGMESSGGLSLEIVIAEGTGLRNESFPEAPTFCQLCCEKVVAVESLMKGVRQQVREIKLLLEQSKNNKRGHEFMNFEKELEGICKN